jgi:hypothetical protein
MKNEEGCQLSDYSFQLDDGSVYQLSTIHYPLHSLADGWVETLFWY